LRPGGDLPFASSQDALVTLPHRWPLGLWQCSVVRPCLVPWLHSWLHARAGFEAVIWLFLSGFEPLTSSLSALASAKVVVVLDGQRAGPARSGL